MDGIIIIDKPKEWTSHDVVAKLRNILGIRKIGHVGTLDPFSTGVLPLCIGKATRLSNLLTSTEKTYVGQMRFGLVTDTYDIDGKQVGEYHPPSLRKEILTDAFAKFTGEILQQPPLFSAKKVAGKPLYKYARKGIEIERAFKKVFIKSLELIELKEDTASFQVTCSAGTYVRALAHDIGQHLGCGAHLASLCRTRLGNFDISQAVQLKKDDEVIRDRNYYESRLIPMNELLPEIPVVVVSRDIVRMILHGRDFMRSQIRFEPDDQATLYRVLDESRQFIAIAERFGPRFHPKVVLR